MEDSCETRPKVTARLGALTPRTTLVQARNKIEEMYPPSREKSLVLTKIDEALLWYNQMEATKNGTDRD